MRIKEYLRPRKALVDKLNVVAADDMISFIFLLLPFALYSRRMQFADQIQECHDRYTMRFGYVNVTTREMSLD